MRPWLGRARSGERKVGLLLVVVVMLVALVGVSPGMDAAREVDGREVEVEVGLEQAPSGKPLPWRVNVGGEELSVCSGVWYKDCRYDDDECHYPMGHVHATPTHDIRYTAIRIKNLACEEEQELYRWHVDGLAQYQISGLPYGSRVDIALGFCELDTSLVTGRRVFDIEANETQVVQGFDPAKEAIDLADEEPLPWQSGDCYAVSKTFSVQLEPYTNTVTLDFVKQVGDPFLAWIKVGLSTGPTRTPEPTDTPTPSVTPTAAFLYAPHVRNDAGPTLTPSNTPSATPSPTFTPRWEGWYPTPVPDPDWLDRPHNERAARAFPAQPLPVRVQQVELVLARHGDFDTVRGILSIAEMPEGGLCNHQVEPVATLEIDKTVEAKFPVVMLDVPNWETTDPISQPVLVFTFADDTTFLPLGDAAPGKTHFLRDLCRISSKNILVRLLVHDSLELSSGDGEVNPRWIE